MNHITLTPPHRDEVLRYMGTPPERADESLRTLVDSCSQELLSAIQPRWCFRLVGLSIEPDGVCLDNGLFLPGTALSHHLSGCGQVFVFCATLGARTDLLIRRAECTDMTRALALDCCASALVEQLCDHVETHLQGQFPDGFFPYRFSPGYGDLPLEVNTPLLDLLDAPRQIGLCATSSHLLAPRKSVTALLGVADHPIDSHKRSCLGCPAHDNCSYRKSGGHCGIS